ncbi:MAG: recombinase family protein [Ferruginibacter sp.]|nr:recombinase family protein [Ferruginibacter sp.]
MNNENRIKSLLKDKNSTSNSSSKNAVIYTRVSTKEQAENNGSLETQSKSCKQYCHSQGLNIVREFGGTHESASNDFDRKEFKKTLEFVKNKKNDIKYLIVHSYDRFSRTGANGITIARDLLRDHKVLVISATQPSNLNTPEGELQMSLLLIFSNYDNELRKKKVVDGMVNKLRNGIYMHKPPYGYKLVKNGESSIAVPNEKATFLKMAFNLKVNGMANSTILKKINSLGANLSIKRIGDLFGNPFYCGYLRSSLLGEDIVKGIHEPLISVEMFEQINNAKVSYLKHAEGENNPFPLKGFIKCEKCGKNWTAYVIEKKNKSYYKCNTSGCRCNRSSDSIHEDFCSYLGQFRLHSSLIKPLTLQLKLTFKNMNESNYILRKEIFRKRDELEKDLNMVNMRFGTGKIDEAVHKCSVETITDQITNLDQELRKVDFKISNPDKFVEFAIAITQNLREIWTSGTSQVKQSIQKLIFPTGIYYDNATRNYRTDKTNTIFAAIAELARVPVVKEKGLSCENPLNSSLVAPTGIEPVSKV